MSTTAIKRRKRAVDVSELADLRDTLLEEQRRVSRLLVQIEQVLGGVGTAPEAPARQPQQAPARPSPLDRLSAMTVATADLREANGNLSAVRVARLYGLSLSQLASWLGRTKQGVNKTPDADSLQEALGYYERVARLRLITKDDAGFRKWLRTPHSDIDARNPLELLAKGQGQALADYVDDILSGTPG